MTDDHDRFQGTPCHNCGTVLEGRYCAECGQRATDLKQTFLGLVGEFFEHAFSLDSNFARSIIALVRRPGRLTVDYLEGRRARYFSPLRLYLVMSVIFFWSLSQLGGSGMVSVGGDEEERESSGVDVVDGFIDGAFTPSPTDSTVVPVAVAVADSAAADSVVTGAQGFWERFGQRMEKGAGKVGENPQEYVRRLFGTMSKVMFVLVPMFALLVRLLNFRRKRPYLDFLVFGMHVHALIFMISSVFNIATWIHEPAQEWLQLVGMLLFPLYITVAMRTAFGGSWKRTVAKTTLLMPAYGLCLGLGIMIVAVVQLLLI